VSRGLVFVCTTVLLDMLGLGIIAPVLPKLVLTLTGGDGLHAAAIFGMAFALMQFVCSPLLGFLSDRFGPLGRDRPFQSRPWGSKAELDASLMQMNIIHGRWSCD
jgi:MFS family permease